MAKTIAIIQARMGSSRFPGKVLADLGGKPVLKWVIDRTSQSSLLDDIVIATSLDSANDQIIELANHWDIKYHRGSESDVLQRFYNAAKEYDATYIIRINADNPLVSPSYIDELIYSADLAQVDYLSYATRNGVPVMQTALSFFCEIMTMKCLQAADQKITAPYEREHVTLGIYTQPSEYKIKFLPVPDYADNHKLRYTVDTKADLEILRQVAMGIGSSLVAAHPETIISFVKSRPDLMSLMAQQNNLQPKSIVKKPQI